MSDSVADPKELSHFSCVFAFSFHLWLSVFKHVHVMYEHCHLMPYNLLLTQTQMLQMNKNLGAYVLFHNLVLCYIFYMNKISFTLHLYFWSFLLYLMWPCFKCLCYALTPSYTAYDSILAVWDAFRGKRYMWRIIQATCYTCCYVFL